MPIQGHLDGGQTRPGAFRSVAFLEWEDARMTSRDAGRRLDQTDGVRVASDRSKSWAYALFILLIPVVLFSIFASIAFFSDGPVTGVLVMWPFAEVIAALVAVAHGIYCVKRPAEVSYFCDGSVLQGLRGDRVVESVDCSKIKDLWLYDGWSWFAFLITPPPPVLTRLEVDVSDSHTGIRRVRFPGMILWGETARRDAERAIYDAADFPKTAWSRPLN